MGRTAKGMLIVAGVLLLACMGCCGLLVTHNAAKRAEFLQAARELGFEPSIGGVADYIRESVEPGMPRGEVEEILGSIAPLRVKRGELDEKRKAGWGPMACDDLWIELGPLPLGARPMIACHDEQGGLVRLDFTDPDAPPLRIYAPAQQ